MKMEQIKEFGRWFLFFGVSVCTASTIGLIMIFTEYKITMVDLLTSIVFINLFLFFLLMGEVLQIKKLVEAKNE